MSTRKATKSDLLALKRLFLILDGDAVRYQSDAFIRKERTTESLLEIINDPNADFLVMEFSDVAVGLAYVRVKDTPDYSNVKKRRLAHLTDLVVAEEHRGRGYGTELIRAAQKWAREKRAEAMRLMVFPENLRAIQLYIEHGFTEVMRAMECEL
ncbi:MAG: GNAT family N-acetyltransferase [Spirochaetales bacterium]|jgi:ribosomal protein S18 acetylase RimI-like enzyme|nr:GNAT family N-acetyltransferase [Spirochaetales bacterium]